MDYKVLILMDVYVILLIIILLITMTHNDTSQICTCIYIGRLGFITQSHHDSLSFIWSLDCYVSFLHISLQLYGFACVDKLHRQAGLTYLMLSYLIRSLFSLCLVLSFD